MSARDLVRQRGGSWHGSYGMIRCPVHDDSTPSCKVVDDPNKSGGVDVHCFGGCDWRDVKAALGVDGQFSDRSENSRRRENCPHEKTNRDAALDIWRKAQPAPGSLVQDYLRGRGITLPVPPSLRYAPALKYPRSGLHLPAVVAAVQAPDRRICGVHRTYLDFWARKAKVSAPKLSLGPQGQGAIRLARAGEVLGISEGIEDALSAMQLFDIPCWAAISAVRLSKIALPDIVKHVHIFADHGAAGVKEAHKAVEVFTGQRRKVTLRLPPDGFDDWNSYLQAEGRGVAA